MSSYAYPQSTIHACPSTILIACLTHCRCPRPCPPQAITPCKPQQQTEERPTNRTTVTPLNRHHLFPLMTPQHPMSRMTQTTKQATVAWVNKEEVSEAHTHNTHNAHTYTRKHTHTHTYTYTNMRTHAHNTQHAQHTGEAGGVASPSCSRGGRRRKHTRTRTHMLTHTQHNTHNTTHTGEAGGVASPCSSRGGRRGGHGLAPHASSLAEGENSTVSVPPGSPGVPPAGIRKRVSEREREEWLFCVYIYVCWCRCNLTCLCTPYEDIVLHSLILRLHKVS